MFKLAANLTVLAVVGFGMFVAGVIIHAAVQPEGEVAEFLKKY